MPPLSTNDIPLNPSRFAGQAFEGDFNANYGSELYYLADWQSLSLWGTGKGAQYCH